MLIGSTFRIGKSHQEVNSSEETRFLVNLEGTVNFMLQDSLKAFDRSLLRRYLFFLFKIAFLARNFDSEITQLFPNYLLRNLHVGLKIELAL